MVSANDQRSLTIILKHGYAPEEQYRTHGEQGPWTDVYAICATMYKMLTGATPSTSMDRMFADDLKAPGELAAGISASTSDTLMKGLAVKKEDRIGSVAELIHALYEGGRVQAAAEKKKMLTWLIAGAAVLLTALIGVGVYFGVTKTLAGRENTYQAGLTGSPEGTGEQSGLSSGDSTENDISAGDSTDAENAGEAGEMLVVEDTEEEEEQLVPYDPTRSIIRYWTYTLLCLPDGTVTKRGNDGVMPGLQDVDYENGAFLFEIDLDGFGILRKDGTIKILTVSTPDDHESDFVNALESWTEIVDVRSFSNIVVGLKADGTLVARKISYYDEEVDELVEQLNNTTDVKLMCAENDSQGYKLVVLKEDGTLELFSTLYEWETDVIRERLEEAGNWADVERLVWQDGWLFGITADEEMKSVYPSYSEAYEYEKASRIVSSTIFYENGLGVRRDGALYTESADIETGMWNRETASTELIQEMRDWRNLIAAVAVDADYGLGITEDGQILEALRNNGNADYKDLKNLEWVDGLYGGKALIAGTRDGQVLTYGAFPENASIDFMYENLEQVKKVVIEEVLDYSANYGDYIFTSVVLEDGRASCTVQDARDTYGNRSITKTLSGVFQIAYIPEKALVALKEDGTLESMYLTMDDDSSYNREEYNEIAGYLSGMTDVVQIECPMQEEHRTCLLLKSDGTLWVIHYEEAQQVKEGVVVEALAYTDYFFRSGYSGFLGLLKDGTVETYSGTVSGTYYASDNAYLVLDTVRNWKNITQLAMGCAHAVGLKADGTVEAAGLNYAGQCDVGQWKDIVYIDVTDNMTLGIDREGNLWRAGSFYR